MKHIKTFNRYSVNENLVNEAISDSDLEAVKEVIRNNKFLELREPLTKLGFKVDFMYEPHTMYTAKKSGQTLVIINKKYVEDADFVHGEIAMGFMNEGVGDFGGGGFGGNFTNSKTGESIRRSSDTIICPEMPFKRNLTDDEKKKMYLHFKNHSWSNVDANNRIILGGGEDACGKFWIDADDLSKLPRAWVQENEVSDDEVAPSFKHVLTSTEEKNDYMLDVLPPMYIDTVDGVKVGKGFAVSEPASDFEGKPTFGIYFEHDGKFYEAEAWLDGISFGNYHGKAYARGNTAHTVERWEDRKKRQS